MNKWLYILKKLYQNKWKFNTELYFPAIWNSTADGLPIRQEI